ncbi:DUF5458 family protein [Flaviaesturariibacter amylovorans]|uniref:DUF5458 family protein n=1 Tax=Flaviaesturariibacter amylovorans TaxID=1084520 RepID=A0ABP8HRD8_9BACT
MSETNLQQQEVAAEAAFLDAKPIPSALPTRSLDESVKALAKFGGFDFLESSIDGVKNLNPERKALKKIFLTEGSKKAERESLKKKLDLWIKMLSESDDLSGMFDKATQRLTSISYTLKNNLRVALETTRQLETNYRSLALFYKNAESDKIKNVTIVNAAFEDMKDLDNTRFIDYIADELKQNYDRLDLRNHYAILALPGYLGSNKVVEKWAKIAHSNKVMLVTDFENLDNVDEVIDMFESENLTGGDVYRSNVMMTCNWLVGRGKNQEVGEEEDVMVPPSSAMAGKLYTTLMSQVAAGKKHGGMNEVDGVKFDLKKSEISTLDRIGLVPMVNEYGKVMAFSAKTLFNGDNLGLQTYSVVRVFDYINKTLIDFLNRRAFENWTGKTEKELREQIVKFLDGITGPSNLIEKFRIDRFERDEVNKDRIHLDIHITPYFPAKSFMLKLDGTKGDDGNTNWDTQTKQQ